MKLMAAGLLALTVIAGSTAAPAADTPREWIDAKTGHRVVRISTGPGMSSLYFHQQSFTPQGDKMVISTAEGIAAVELKTWKITPVVTGKGLQLLFTGRKTRTVYYSTRARSAGATGAADRDGQTGAIEV